MRALIIEDEAALREGLREELAKAGFTVDVAADGEEGLFAGLEYPIDVAVVDLGLPKLPGLEVIRRWRAKDRRFPILILTARDRWQDKVEGLDAGADDYVAKPYHFEEVLARLRAQRQLLGVQAGFAQAAAWQAQHPPEEEQHHHQQQRNRSDRLSHQIEMLGARTLQ